MEDTKKSILDYETVSPDAESTVLGTKNGAVKRFKVSDLGGSSGGGGGIIDVDTLPTENIDASAIYRVKELAKATMEMPSYGISVPLTVVDDLPEQGEKDVVYFLTTDQKVYVCLTAEQATEVSTTEGWHEYGTIYGMECVVVGSVDEIPEGGIGVLLTTTVNLYHYCNGKFSKIVTSDNFEFDETTGTLVLNL